MLAGVNHIAKPKPVRPTKYDKEVYHEDEEDEEQPVDMIQLMNI
jgi:hypothetical protein